MQAHQGLKDSPAGACASSFGPYPSIHQCNPSYAREDNDFCMGALSYPDLIYRSSSPEFEEETAIMMGYIPIIELCLLVPDH